MAEAAAEAELSSALSEHSSSLSDSDNANRDSLSIDSEVDDMITDNSDLTPEEKKTNMRNAEVAKEEIEQKKEMASIELTETRERAKQALGKAYKLGEVFDLGSIEPDQAKVREDIHQTTIDGAEKVVKGEGKSLKDLPNDPELQKKVGGRIRKWLTDKLGETVGGGIYDHKGFIMTIISSLIVSLVMKLYAIPKDERAKKVNRDWYERFLPKGCVQYHIKTGAIRQIGICGDPCSLKSSDDCQSASYCKYDSDNQTCRLRDISCCPSCSSGSDCSSKLGLSLNGNSGANTGQTCNKDADCLVGSCSSNGNCQISSNDLCDSDSSSCICPVPGASLQTQMNSGGMGFCDPDTSLPCSASGRICSLSKNGGLCDSCTDKRDDSPCKNPTGNLSENDSLNCMCEGDDWITIPVCIQPDDFFLTVTNVARGVNDWAPDTSTPLAVKILTWGSILGLAIMTIWYLIKLIKTLRNNNK